MAIIYSYPYVSTVNNSDTLVISVSDDTGDDGFLTKSLTANTLASYVTARVNLNFLGDTGTGVVNLDTQNLTISGTSNEIETAASSQTLQIGLPDSVTITSNLSVGTGIANGNLTVGGSGSQSQIAGYLDLGEVFVNDTLEVDGDTTLNNDLDVSGNTEIGGSLNMTLSRINNVLDPTQPQDAATKSYVDSLVSGGFVFRGSFRADSGLILSGANSGSYLYNCPGGAGTRVAVSTGDYYIVANTGGNFYCSGDLLNVGDSIIAVADAAADSSTINDWSTVESDNVEGTGITNTIPVWTDSQVIGNSMLSQDAGATKVTVTGGVGIDDYISHNSDNNTRFGFPSNDSFTLDTNGTERLKVSSGGNVGINTSTPQRTLDVNGVILSSNRSGQAFRAEPDNGSGFAVTEFFNDNPILRLARNTGGDAVKIQADGDSFFNGGKVSIGTSPGSAQLHVHTFGSFPAAKITNVNPLGTGLIVEKPSGGSGDIQRWQRTNNDVKAVIDSGGNFGIGLTNPLFSVDVFGDKGIRTRKATSADGFAIVALNSLTTPTSACGIYYTNNVGSLILNDTTQNQNVKIRALGDSYIKGGRFGVGNDLTTARSESILFVKNGDVEIERPDSGSYGGRLILQTPDKTANYAISVDNNGDIISTGLQSGSVKVLTNGTGTTNTLPLWSDGPTGALGDSPVVYDPVGHDAAPTVDIVLPGQTFEFRNAGRFITGAMSAGNTFNNATLDVTGDANGKAATFRGGVIVSNNPGGVQVDNTSVVIGGGANDIVSGSDHCLIVGNGNQIINNSDQSVAFGQGNTITGSTDAFAVGNSNTLTSSLRTLTLGYDNNVQSASSFIAGGSNTVSTGDTNIAIGFNNTVNNGNSFAIGNIVTSNQGEMVLGFRNYTTGYPTPDKNLGLGETKFVIGVGSGTVTPADNNAVIITEGGINGGSSGTVPQVPRIVLPTIVNFNFADDTAAAAGGIPVGGLYHSAGALRIRLT